MYILWTEKNKLLNRLSSFREISENIVPFATGNFRKFKPEFLVESKRPQLSPVRSLSCKSKSFSYETFWLRTCFETGKSKLGNSLLVMPSVISSFHVKFILSVELFYLKMSDTNLKWNYWKFSQTCYLWVRNRFSFYLPEAVYITVLLRDSRWLWSFSFVCFARGFPSWNAAKLSEVLGRKFGKPINR